MLEGGQPNFPTGKICHLAVFQPTSISEGLFISGDNRTASVFLVVVLDQNVRQHGLRVPGQCPCHRYACIREWHLFLPGGFVTLTGTSI